MTTVVIALEVGWRSLAAEVTVNALIVHVVSTGDVLGIFVCGVGHLVLGLVKGRDSKVWRGRRNRFFPRCFGHKIRSVSGWDVVLTRR
jgi:hypothetical protein